MTSDDDFPRVEFGVTYECGDYDIHSTIVPEEYFLRDFLATEVIVNCGSRIYTSQADSFYFLYQISAAILQLMRNKSSLLIRTGEQIEIEILNANQTFPTYIINDSGKLIFSRQVRIEFIIYTLCNIYSLLCSSIHKHGVDVEGYIIKYKMPHTLLE